MSATWTAEQILALAPDASSAKNGKGLASIRKWVVLGQAELAVWGECQGSGKNPYRTQIDLSEPAFQCSCPSRKFPCKHGLGLFLVWAEQSTAFSVGTPPSWVEEWLSSRQQRQEKRTQKQKQEQSKPIDPAAQAKRASDRAAKVTAGIQDLQLWLHDLTRHGLATVQQNSYQFWDMPAARLVDAQAPGLARQLREMASIPSSGSGWAERLLSRLGKLHLLLEGFQRLESLPPGTQADIRSLIGWTQTQDELLAEAIATELPNELQNAGRDDSKEVLRDHWLILGQYHSEEDRLRIRRSWLWGQESQHSALLLDFAHGNQPMDASLIAGTVLDAELVFYPSAYPLRALLKTRHHVPTPMQEMPGYPTIAIALQAYAQAMSCNPWLERFPVVLQAVTPVCEGNHWFVQDSEGRFLKLSDRFSGSWQLLALSGGHLIALFAEWEGETLLPLSVWTENKFYVLKGGAL
ncbi:SWIM zinc finger family protein [Trichocoleus sp. FACHB-262]|uniref:SWIM zinc finger family protein n=1 Tax=Trichocoleus sp. FACHB-262 TaxID=2692869 RepID=UPI00168773CD|nr:SWIM zinc finger family protein [Trichocoleus sp. FACHB-262]MBD2120926.1 SWIM zinc finger family protein [Trichocoleus sp. FACHB-262]